MSSLSSNIVKDLNVLANALVSLTQRVNQVIDHPENVQRQFTALHELIATLQHALIVANQELEECHSNCADLDKKVTHTSTQWFSPDTEPDFSVENTAVLVMYSGVGNHEPAEVQLLGPGAAELYPTIKHTLLAWSYVQGFSLPALCEDVTPLPPEYTGTLGRVLHMPFSQCMVVLKKFNQQDVEDYYECKNAFGY